MNCEKYKCATDWDEQHIVGYWDVTPRGPGGGAPWQAQSACWRQAQQSGAMPKAWILGLSYNIADEAWVRELMGARVAGKLMDLLCKVVFR